ncbi:MAG: hypothetical protein AAF984_05970 [Verrucomicrobiota bacterium]
MIEDSILVKHSGEAGIIKVIGKGCFKNARYVKIFNQKAAELGISQIVFDLQECIHMDSTFMGILAGMALEAQKTKSPIPKIYHINHKNLELLQTLGIDRLLDIRDDDMEEMRENGHIDLNKKIGKLSEDEISESMLEAHEKLVEADDKNADKFEDVIHFLKEKTNMDNV